MRTPPLGRGALRRQLAGDWLGVTTTVRSRTRVVPPQPASSDDEQPRAPRWPPRASRRARCGEGIVASRRVPAPGGLSIARTPSTTARRSCSPRSPLPASGRAPPTPSSATTHHDAAVAVAAQLDARLGRLRVARDVGQRLGHDEVRGRLDRRRQAAVDRDLARRPGPASAAASAAIAGSRPLRVRMAGWMPRASSRRSPSAASRRTAEPVDQRPGLGVADRRAQHAQLEGERQRAAAGRRRGGRARCAGGPRRRPRRCAGATRAGPPRARAGRPSGARCRSPATTPPRPPGRARGSCPARRRGRSPPRGGRPARPRSTRGPIPARAARPGGRPRRRTPRGRAASRRWRPSGRPGSRPASRAPARSARRAAPAARGRSCTARCSSASSVAMTSTAAAGTSASRTSPRPRTQAHGPR